MEHVIYKHRSIDVVSRVFDWVGFISVVHIDGKLIDQYAQGLTMYGTKMPSRPGWRLPWRRWMRWRMPSGGKP